jgi:signal transduction histidine kinase
MPAPLGAGERENVEPHPPEVGAMLEIAELFRGGTTPRDAFQRLVAIVHGVFAVHAFAIRSANKEDAPLVWTSGAPGYDRQRIERVASAALRFVQSDEGASGEGTLDAQSWLTLPIAEDSGTVLGVLAVAPVFPVGEAGLAFLSCVTMHLSVLLARGERLRQVFAVRERIEWLARAPDLRLVEEQKARVAAESSAQALGVACDLTAVLLSSFDYLSALRHVVRIVAGHLACGCVVDVVEDDGLRRIAHVPTRSEPIVARALAPLVADVMHRGTPAWSARPSPAQSAADAWGGLDAARARRALEVDWIVSVPMTTSENAAVGVITIFGSMSRHPPVPLEIAEELGRRAATAVENGRVHLKAVAALRERERVLAMVSHDLKNPLSAILMSVARLLEDTTMNGGPPSSPDPPSARPASRSAFSVPVPGRPQLELIERSARRMMKLVADLLDFSAMDAGKISVSPKPCPIRERVLEVFQDLGPQAESIGIELRCEISEELPPAWADLHRVTQVLTNLVSNAIKFTPAGGRVTASAELLTTRELAITVGDTGPGIPPEHIERIFEPFWQAPAEGTAGSGLGLAISRGLVELSGGRIVALPSTSGATVTFTLPIDPRAAETEHGFSDRRRGCRAAPPTRD